MTEDKRRFWEMVYVALAPSMTPEDSSYGADLALKEWEKKWAPPRKGK